MVNLRHMNKYLNKKIIITILIFVVGLAVGGAGFYLFQSQKSLSSEEAGKIAIDFINKALEKENAGVTASLVSATGESGVYKIHLKIQDKEYDSYITEDGKYLFSVAFNLEEEKTAEATDENIAQNSRPDVKVFVMSYCPYGLQMQKAFLPVYDLLKDKVDMGIYFVDYIMHGKKEIDDNLREYCIQKDQEDKFYDYLSCFVQDGNFESCLTQANIDQALLETCVSQTDSQYNITAQYNDQSTWLSGSYPKFDVNADLNNQYGVQGSPTVVINGQVVEVDPRSPENFKEIICSAFDSQPAECSQTLSSEASSPGFGTTAASASSDGSCQ